MKEWETEPDYVEFEAHGIKCMIIRNFSGALCGYCRIPEGHKYYDKGYEDIPYEAHGGLTYAEFKAEKSYWIGFDCAHCGDIVPRYPSLCFEEYGTYKNIKYVRKECKKLAKQIAQDQ